jgi:hypothetical protein
MLAGSNATPEEDEEIRRAEKEFYEKLSEPPKEVDGLKYLLSKHKGEMIDSTIAVEKSAISCRADMGGSDGDGQDVPAISEDNNARPTRKRSRKE